VINDNGIVHIHEIDLEMGRKAIEWYTYHDDDFSSVKGETVWEVRLARGEWSVTTRTRTVLTSTATEFHLRAELDAYEGEKRVYSENWDHVIERDLV